jgi:hypothetical protein
MPQLARQRIVVPFDGHIIGQGFNSESGERVGTGLNIGDVGEDTQADGQAATFSFQMVTSQQSLERALNISADMEARYLLFSGGAKFSFAEKNALNSSSTYIVASCNVTNALRSGRDFTPMDNATRLLQAADTEGFKRAFGDRFCQALRTGGEFHAVVRITSSHTKHQSDIAASLHGEMNGLVGGGSFKAAFALARNDAASHTEVNINIFQLGGQGDQVQMPGADADKIRDIMNHFAASAHAHPVAFEAELVTYDTLALPGPSAAEQEDRRRILEDCQARKQKYWSAISELDFLQTEDAGLIFADLPPLAELARLQNEFRRVLGALMAFARAVSVGATPPVPFVPDNEPVLPRLPRRATTTFAVWWARRSDPLLLADEQTLIHRIGGEAQPLLAVPLQDAPAEAVQKAAALLEKLDLSFSGAPFSSRPPLQSIAALPKMLASPLRQIDLSGNQLDDLAGIDTFTRLESLGAERNRLRDISAIASLAGLKALQLRKNQVSDIQPIAGLTELQTLIIDGNQVETLDALAGLKQLRVLLLGASIPVSTVEGQPSPPPDITDNPIHDARALGHLKSFANPFVLFDRLLVRLTTLPDLADAGGAALDALAAGQDAGTLEEGEALRVGVSTEFRFTSANGVEPEALRFIGGLLENSLEPMLWTAVLLPKRKKIGIAFVSPTTPSQSLDRTHFARKIAANKLQILGPALLGIPPEIVVEVRGA